MTTRRDAAETPSASSAATWTGIITVVMTLLGWSSVPLFISHFADRLDPWTSNGWRYGFSALLWAPVLIWGLLRRSLPKGLWRAALVPSLFNALGQTAFAWSFYKTDPTTATFGLRLQIVFVSIGAYLLFPTERELLRRRETWLAIALVLGGVLGTTMLAPDAGASPATHSLGVMLAIAGGLLFAGYGLSVRKYAHGLHPVTAFAAISQYTAVLIVALMVVLGHDLSTGSWQGGTSVLKLPAGQFSLLLLSAFIGIAVGHVFYYISIARLGVAVSSGVIQLQPFLVAIGAYFLLEKPVTAGQVACGLVAVAGAVMLLWVQWQLSRSRTAARERAEDLRINPDPQEPASAGAHRSVPRA